MSISRALRNVFLLLAWMFVQADVHAGPGPSVAAEKLRSRLVAAEKDPLHAGFQVGDRQFLAEFYSRRGYRPLWSDAALDELTIEIEAASGHGLDPHDYHYSLVRELRADPVRRTDLDLIATSSLARLAYHLRFGKVDPSQFEPTWNFGRQLAADPFTVLETAITEVSIAELLHRLAPTASYYARLKEALAYYRILQGEGGWSEISAGPVLRTGMQNRRVAELYRRLLVYGDLDRPTRDETLFDESLAAAVRQFQQRHSLEADGVVGPRTLESLNVPVEARIDQIRVNLERIRWVFRDIAAESDFVLVNIAAFRLWLIRAGETIWTTRVQVGTRYRQTPVFRSSIEQIVFNPTWTVPPTILREDLLPQLRQDPTQLQARNMTILDGLGQIIDPESIDWANVNPRRFPYAIRQEPGPQNALGRVKFIFPNPHFVFLHDTPAGALFKRTDRTFSSGCIRVEDALRLAGLLLERKAGWTAPEIARTTADGRSQTVPLERPVTILILYATIVADSGRDVVFLRDVYNRDRRVLEALNAEFRFTPPGEYESLLGSDRANGTD